MTKLTRCTWPGTNPLMVKYHDEEWGVPSFDDRKLFEYIVLDTFQAGLSWAIILNKRENFRKVFDGFDPVKIALYDINAIKRLEADMRIIRNKLKIRATIFNAQAFLAIQTEFGSFANYLWGFVGGQPVTHQHQADSDIGATSTESNALSVDLKSRGFKFVGPTICYAFMQGAGLVNDHLTSCFRYAKLK